MGEGCFFLFVGNDFFSKRVTDNMLTSQVTDAPVVTSDLVVFIILLFTLFVVGGNPHFKGIHFM
jgi:hypothetical protein